jgi:hypothetical protein
MSYAQLSGRRIRAFWVLLAQLAVPILLFVVITNAVIDSDWFITTVGRYRPTAGESTLEVNVARQLWGMDAALRTQSASRRVLLVGSSSVVNGVDADTINGVWRADGVPLEAINVGQTGLIAYELPLLKRYLLNAGVDTVVFLYNTFSFGNRLLGSVVGARWDTGEMYRLQPLDPTDPEAWRRYATGALSENLVLVRYGNVIKRISFRALRGRLREAPYFSDFPPEPELNEARARVPETALPSTDWLRAAYVDSLNQPGSLGYRGLVRFLELARLQGVTVIVAPIPEPEFGRSNRWRQGVDPDVIDKRVATIAASHGVMFLPRSEFSYLEDNDSLFRDPTHFNRFGRDIYSRRLARDLAPLIKKDTSVIR